MLRNESEDLEGKWESEVAKIRKWPAFLLCGINVSLVIFLSEILTFFNIYSTSTKKPRLLSVNN